MQKIVTISGSWPNGNSGVARRSGWALISAEVKLLAGNFIIVNFWLREICVAVKIARKKVISMFGRWVMRMTNVICGAKGGWPLWVALCIQCFFFTPDEAKCLTWCMCQTWVTFPGLRASETFWNTNESKLLKRHFLNVKEFETTLTHFDWLDRLHCLLLWLPRVTSSAR